MLRIFIKMTYTIQTQDIINDEKPGVLKEIKFCLPISIDHRVMT